MAKSATQPNFNQIAFTRGRFSLALPDVNMPAVSFVQPVAGNEPGKDKPPQLNRDQVL